MRRCAELVSHFQYLDRRKRMLTSMVSHLIPIYIRAYSKSSIPRPCFLKRKLFVAGYLIPKGWKVLVWNRAVHMDPENYSNPKDFDPSRWDVSWIYRTCIYLIIPFFSFSSAHIYIYIYIYLHVLILYDLLDFCVEFYTESWDLPSFWSRK
jgi:hypothetical protein